MDCFATIAMTLHVIVELDATIFIKKILCIKCNLKIGVIKFNFKKWPIYFIFTTEKCFNIKLYEIIKITSKLGIAMEKILIARLKSL